MIFSELHIFSLEHLWECSVHSCSCPWAIKQLVRGQNFAIFCTPFASMNQNATLKFPIRKFKMQFYLFVSSPGHKNQAQMMGWHGWDSTSIWLLLCIWFLAMLINRKNSVRGHSTTTWTRRGGGGVPWMSTWPGQKSSYLRKYFLLLCTVMGSKKEINYIKLN